MRVTQFERAKSSNEIERVKTATDALEKLVQSPEFRDRLERSRSSTELHEFIKQRSRSSAELVLQPAAEESHSEVGAAAAAAAPAEGQQPESAAADIGGEEPAALPEVVAEQQPAPEVQTEEQPVVLQAEEQPVEVGAEDQPTVLQVGGEPVTTEGEQPQPAVDQETGEGIAVAPGNHSDYPFVSRWTY